MFLLDEYYNPIKLVDSKNTNKQLFWQYDLTKKDFFVTKSPDWVVLKSESYIMKIEDTEIILPANYNILIGDYDVGFDVITPEEIIGRDFDAVSFNDKLDLDSGKLSPLNTVGYIEDHEFIFPLTSNLVPVNIGKRVILLSDKNVYNRLKKITFFDFISIGD